MSEQERQHWRRIVCKDSPHLTVWDIEGKTPLRVTIESHNIDSVVAMGPGEDPEQRKDMLFLRFKGGKKALGLNVTNCWLIERTLGSPYPDDWVGKQIVLRTAECKREPCIRVDTPAGTRFPRLIPKFRYTDKQEGGAQ